MLVDLATKAQVVLVVLIIDNRLIITVQLEVEFHLQARGRIALIIDLETGPVILHEAAALGVVSQAIQGQGPALVAGQVQHLQDLVLVAGQVQHRRDLVLVHVLALQNHRLAKALQAEIKISQF